jgi:Protein of unknown function/Domain of unknown function (DUF1835)
MDITHITFGMRGDGSLRAVLKRAGRRDRVVRLWDDLSLGPIDPPEPKARWAWAKRELGLFPYSQYLFVKRNNAWEAALSAPGRRIAWVSRRMPHEYCGFLEWLWRLGDAPCDVVDIHDVKFDWHLRDGTVRRQGVPCIGYIREEHIRDNAFWDLARPLTAARRRRYREDWRKLRAENAPLRVLKGSTLVSAPISHYDGLILSHTRRRWLRKVARVLGRSFGLGPHHKACLHLFHGRLHKLVQEGVLEGEGNIAHIRFSQVRRIGKAEAAAL